MYTWILVFFIVFLKIRIISSKIKGDGHPDDFYILYERS